jgi:hypothetical protein
MVTFLLLLIIVLQIISYTEEKRFRKIVVFQMQEMHIRVSEKQDRIPRIKEEFDHAIVVDNKKQG